MEAITNEKQYWEEFHKWEAELKSLMKVRKLINDPSKFIESYENILNDGIKKQVIKKEWADEKIRKLHQELTAPSKFKEKIKKKLSTLFKKKQEETLNEN